MLSNWKRATSQPYRAPDAFRDDNHLNAYHHEQKDNVTKIPETVVTLSYGADGVRNLFKKLKADNPVIIEGALDILAKKILVKPANIVEAVSSRVVGSVESLNRLTIHENVRISTLALKCLASIATQMQGRVAEIKGHTIDQLFKVVKMVRAPLKVKVAAYNVLQHIASSRQTVGGVIDTEGLIHFLVDTVATKQTPSLIKSATLRVLSNTLNISKGMEAALDEPLIIASSDLLEMADGTTTSLALKVLNQLCLIERGRNQATGTGETIAKLVPLLKAKKVEDRRNSSATLVTLTLEKEGKMQFHKVGMEGLMFSLMHEDDLWVQQNVMKVVNTMSVMPPARDTMHDGGAVKRMKEIDAGANDKFTSEVAAKAIRGVLWIP